MTQLMTNINVAIVNRNVDFFDTETTFGVEGQPVGFDRRVLVQSGKIYVFIDGMYDSYGHQQVYYEGEMVYVSNAKADVNRKIVILRRRGARIEIAGNCGLSGVTTTAAEMASVVISAPVTPTANTDSDCFCSSVLIRFATVFQASVGAPSLIKKIHGR